MKLRDGFFHRSSTVKSSWKATLNTHSSFNPILVWFASLNKNGRSLECCWLRLTMSAWSTFEAGSNHVDVKHNRTHVIQDSLLRSLDPLKPWFIARETHGKEANKHYLLLVQPSSCYAGTGFERCEKQPLSKCDVHIIVTPTDEGAWGDFLILLRQGPWDLLFGRLEFKSWLRNLLHSNLFLKGRAISENCQVGMVLSGPFESPSHIYQDSFLCLWMWLRRMLATNIRLPELSS